MGYIKKLKNNELVGGTDKTTIYPVTSTEAVFEEITNGNESSFKSQKTINKEQQDELDAHNGRVTYLEDHAVKSVTINGGTKTYTVDNAGNVNLDVYTTESAEGQATLAEEVGDIRSIVGTKDSPASDTLVNRVGELETLVGGSGQGSVNTRIANTKAEILGDAAEDYNTLGKVEDKILEEVARATAEETELGTYVHAIEGGNIRVKTSTPTNPDTGAPANTVYRVAGTTTYSDYMWNGTTMVKMAEYNVDTLESQFGYYKWETASNTISITTSNQVAGSPIGSYVLTSGGSFKIKMSNKATGACTLNMNGTGVKTLLYNGDPVASNNTWEDDEVISVYYDGTNYQASNSQGGSNKKIDAYLLGDLRTLAVGETYSKDEAIKTSDKQLLRMSKPVEAINLSEVVHKGSLYTDGTYTYEADANITAFNPNTEYTTGQYALGSRSVVTIAVTAASTEGTINVTIGDTTADITASTNADTTATSIAALTVEGWTLAADGSNVIATCNTIGNNTLSVSYTDTDSTGATLTDTAVAGTSVIRKYDGSSWSNATVAGMVTDAIYVERDAAWLATNAAKQNDVVQELYSVEKKTLTPVKNLFSVWNTTFYPRDSSSSSVSCFIYRNNPTKNTNNVATRRTKASSSTVFSGITLNKTLVDGQRYNLKFDYVNNAADGIYIDIRNSDKQRIKSIVTIKLGTGSVDFDFVGDSSMYYIMIGLVAAAPTDKWLYLNNIVLSKLENVKDNTQNEIENIWKTTGVRYYVPDEAQWNPGRVKIADGTVVTDVSNTYFCEIDLTNVKSIYAYIPASTTSLYGPCFYKADGTFISGITKASSGWFTIIVPPDAAFMRYDRYSSFDGKYLIFYYDKPKTGSTNSSYKVPMEVGYITTAGGINSSQSYDATSENGYAFASTNGEFKWWRNTGMIEVEEGTYTISFDKGNRCFVTLYDLNRNRISGIDYGFNDDVSEAVVNTSNVKYIRFMVTDKQGNCSMPTCTITGSFTNGFKIAKLKKQASTQADTIVVPVWIENMFSSNGTTSNVQDDGEWHIDFGRIALPPTYDPDGEPTRLIIYSHGGTPRYNPVYKGDGDYEYGGDGTFETTIHINPTMFLKEGYAVMDMDACFAVLNSKNVGTIKAQEGRQITNCYEAAYNYVINNYNIKKDGILLGGRSFGGVRSMELIMWSKIPIIAAALHVPYVGEAKFWASGYRLILAKYAGFTNYENVTDGAINAEQLEILKQNYPKLLRTSPMFAACAPTFDEFFAEHEITIEGTTQTVSLLNGWQKWGRYVVSKWKAKFPIPIKMWACTGDDTAGPYDHANILYSVGINGGSDIELRLFTGGSHNPIIGSEAITTPTYITKYGETINNAPVFYVETIRYWRRYEQD